MFWGKLLLRSFLKRTLKKKKNSYLEFFAHCALGNQSKSHFNKFREKKYEPIYPEIYIDIYLYIHFLFFFSPDNKHAIRPADICLCPDIFELVATWQPDLLTF